MIDFLINHIKITRKDVYFGISIIVAAYFLNNLVLAANGYLAIKIPLDNKEAFYVKEYKGKTYILYLSKNDFNKELDFIIKKDNKIISTGRCIIPNGYYQKKLGLHLENDEVKCLIEKDELSKQMENIKNFKKLQAW